MLNLSFIRYSLANLTLVLCGLMFITLLVSIYYADGAASAYLWQLGFMLGASFMLKFKVDVAHVTKLRMQDLFFTTTVIWLYVILVCLIPYISIAGFAFSDALFEITSGVTTTGASVIPSLHDLPPSLLWWRAITQWLGGIGFVVVGVIVLPNLNSGGMRLFKTESSDSEEKAFPHYRDLAKSILILYVGMTLVLAVALWLSGMRKFYAIQYAFSALSTGGFSPEDVAFSGILNQYAVAALFIFFASLPYQVIAVSLVTKKPWRILTDKQVQTFTLIIAIGGLLITLDRYYDGTDHGLSFFVLFKDAVINILNVQSNTGYSISPYWEWGSVSMLVMVILSIIGGCSGSTAGGLKIFRFNILFLFFRSMVIRTIHPQAQARVTYAGQQVEDSDFASIFFFILFWMLTFAFGVFCYAFSGLDVVQAANSTLTTITNTGLSFGPNVSPNGTFAEHSVFQKVVGSALMLLGRLEFTTFLIVFFPKFWRYN